MKSLYESLLDDEEEIVDKLDVKPVIKAWMSKYARNVSYNINDDNTIDVNGHLSLYTKEIPGYIQFNNIKGNFHLVGFNGEKLNGMPKKVKGGLFITGCINLKDLEGAPEEVKGYIDISDCLNIESLKGLEHITCEEIKLSDIYITNLEYMPTVKHKVELTGLRLLNSLKGMPKKVGTLDIMNCNMKNLKGIAEIVDGSMAINFCTNLTTLKYMPKEIHGNLYMVNNSKLKDVKFDTKVLGDVDIL